MILFVSGLGFLPGILWLIYFYRKDSVEPEPTKLIFKSYFQGMFVVGAVAVVATPFSFSEFFSAVFIAPIVEELLKFLAVFLFVFRTREFDEPMDGIIYAVSVALGYASLENAFYMYEAHQNDRVGWTFVLRGLLSVPGHALFSSIWGNALGVLKFNPQRQGFVVSSLLVAMLFHGIFNLLCLLYLGFGVLMIFFVSYSWKRFNRSVNKALLDSPHRKQGN